MNNVQLYIAIGIPLILTIITLGSNVALYIALTTKVDKVAGELNGKIDRVAGELNTKIDRVAGELNMKIDRVAADLNVKVDKVLTDLNFFYRELGRHDKAIEVLERPRS